jgi:hypothetical protein
MISFMKILLPILLAGICSISGCTRMSSSNSSQPAPAPSIAAMSITSADLKKLRWIEGTWRGTGDGQTPFYERYKFENDVTLAVETLEGDKQDKVAEVTKFELKNGQFAGGSGGSRYVATSIDEKSINFDPVTKARNSFRWERESENSWKATLNWTEGTTAKERVYHMERWPKP